MTVEDGVVSADLAAREYQERRGRLRRLALGCLGLFWVCVLLLLMR